MIGFMRPPQATEDSYAHDAIEKTVSLSQLGINGTVVNQIGDDLFCDTKAGRKRLYSAPHDLRIMKISRPNTNSEICLLEFNQTANLYRFTILSIKTGAATSTKFEPGDIIWNNAVGNIALHPSQPLIAYLSGQGHHQFGDPQAYWDMGVIYELNYKTGVSRELFRNALDGTICYDPSGKHLYAPGLIAKSVARTLPQTALDEYDSSDDPGHGIYEVDLTNLSSRPVAEGSNCEVSGDGKLLIVSSPGVIDRGTNWDIKRWSPLPAVPSYVWPAGWINSEIVIASSLPISKSAVKFAAWTGSISGPHQLMRLILMNVKTHETAVIRSDLDRYQEFVYVPNAH